jgi:hypothetical protein
MPVRTIAILAMALLPTAVTAAECRLDHASYEEPVSGAVIQFRPRDTTSDAALTTGLFELRLPKVAEIFQGDITWNAGGNARPDGEIGRACLAEDEADDEVCWLWTGNVYSLGNSSAALVGDADMAAPKAVLLSDFGRSLATTAAFTEANPDRGAFDVFTLTGCGS